MKESNRYLGEASTEGALRQSEARLRLFIAASSNVVYRTNADWTRIEQLAGKEMLADKPEPIGDWMKNYILPEDRPSVQAAIRQAIAGKSVFDLEHQVVQADGSTGWMHSRAVPIFDKQGEIMEWFGAGTDITERKRTEAALRESAANCQAQLEEAKDQAAEWHKSKDLLQAGADAFRVMLGDTLRPLGDPIEIQYAATRLLGQHLHVDWAFYAEVVSKNRVDFFQIERVYHVPAHPFPEGLYPVESFSSINHETLRAGQNVVVYDLETDVRISEKARRSYRAFDLGSWVCIPLNKSGRLVAVLAVHETRPRRWTPEEIHLMEEVAERTWAAVERARAEKALAENEERLQLSVKAANLFTWDINPQTGEINHSSNSAEVLGFEVEKDSNENFSFIHPDDKEFVTSAIRQTLDNKSPLDVEHRIINPQNGQEIWVRAQGQLTKKGSNEYSFIGITQNITKRKQAEEALHTSEERYRIALQSAEMAAWDWDVENDLVQWNDQHYYLLGLQSTPFAKSSAFFLQFIHPEDLQRVSNELMQAVEETGLYHAEFRIVRTDGQVRWMNGYGRAVSKKASKTTRMAGVMFDITHYKLLEQQKEGFISIASHELKTPLTSLKAYGEILQEILEEADDKANVELVNKMNGQIDRLAGLINDLLDTTKILEQQLPLNRERFNINELIRQRAEDHQHMSPGHTITLDLCDDALVQADQERIGQVLTNLISNAIKYSPKGGEVRVSCKARQDGVLVSVQDHGVGIPKQMQEKVFERFFRVPDVQVRNYPGMGLGLYITAGIIHRHGGTIWVESEPGKGATFHFTLPF
ncbi:MAG: PAS domain-containing protein [Williamsia sp.]|nr:PAS domain-containing protein [Williamsia sp.]